MRHLLSIPLALIVASANPAIALAGGHTIAEQIEGRVAVFEEAFAAGDGAAIGALYTDDGTILPPGGAVISGPEAIGVFWQGVIDSGIAGLDLKSGEVEGRGDTAIEVSSFEMFGGDGSVVATGKYIVIWKNAGDGWQLHRDIWNAGN